MYRAIPARFTCIAAFAGFFSTGCATREFPKLPRDQASEPVAAVDFTNIYDSLKLGGPIKAFSNLTLVEKIGAWETFTRPSDKLRFQGAEINGVSYNFFRGQFYSIHIDVMGDRNVKRLIKWVEKTYGPSLTTNVRNFGPKLNRLIVREWRGSQVDFVVKYADDYAGATLIYVDHAMWEALDRPRQLRLASASGAFEGSWSNLDFD